MKRIDFCYTDAFTRLFHKVTYNRLPFYDEQLFLLSLQIYSEFECLPIKFFSSSSIFAGLLCCAANHISAAYEFIQMC